MISQATRFWTFNSLVGAFLDLFIAYFLLCGSTIALFAVKFLDFFGFTFPIPIPDSNLLVDYPTDKISAVQFHVTRKFPFDSVFFRIQNYNANDGLDFDRGDGFRETEGEASCSSKSGARKIVKNETDNSGIRIPKEKGFDMKGKGAVNYRVRGGRQRRKGSFDHGKHSSPRNWITCVDRQRNDKENGEGSSILSGANSCNFEAEAPMVVKSDDNYRQDIEFNELGNPNEGEERPGNPNEAQEWIPFNDDDKYNTIVLLTRELEEEQAARAALYIELEKERNAAATAADEAMAMILRLQEEKASIEMESRQYQRMIEEKSAYDEEEMDILKEIVMRREREKHVLEKEVEAYRQTLRLENDQIYSDFTEDPDLILRQLSMSIDANKQLPEKTIAIVEEEHASRGKSNESQTGESELRVYDVHVIDSEAKSCGKSNESQTGQPPVDDVARLPPISAKSLRRNSTSALDTERTRLDTEVEWLRERLRVVQEGREKLNFSIENREKESLQLQLLEDIAHQLQEIRMLTEPRKARQGSLPLPSSKSSTKKRRHRSVSSGPAKSS